MYDHIIRGIQPYELLALLNVICIVLQHVTLGSAILNRIKIRKDKFELCIFMTK